MTEVVRPPGSPGVRPLRRRPDPRVRAAQRLIERTLAIATGVAQHPGPACHRSFAVVLSWAMSSRLAARAAARSSPCSSSWSRRSMTCCSSWLIFWLRASMSAGAREPGLAPGLFAERLGQAFFQLPDAGVQPDGALVGGEQVGLQGGPGDGGPGAAAGGRRPGFEGVDLLEQVAVPVEEGAVHRGGAGDAGHADLGAVGGGPVERGDDALAAAGGVGLAALHHGPGPAGSPRSRAGRLLCHAVASVARRGRARAGRTACPGTRARWLADDGDRLVDLGALGVAEPVDVALDPADELPDPGISSSAGVASARAHSSTPSMAGGQPFAGAQQVIEVGGQVGEVGDVGAEVVFRVKSVRVVDQALLPLDRNRLWSCSTGWDQLG